MSLNILKNSLTAEEEIDPIFQFREEIASTFKRRFKKCVTQNSPISYQTILAASLIEIGIEVEQNSDPKNLKVWFDNIYSLNHLFDHITCTDIREILIHSNQDIQYETKDGLESFKYQNIGPDDYQLSLDVLASKNNISWNYLTPYVSFYTKINNNQFRATLIHHSTSSNNRSKLFLRRISNTTISLKRFDIDDNCMETIINMINSKKNIVISGATCSGKTSLLSSLLESINTEEHLVILEDTHEIISTSKTRTYLLANDEIQGKSLKDYCAYSLRMRPDRIIIGEMRSKEIVPFILAMNTGHKGLMSTIHANSASDSINRMALLFSIYSGNKDITFEVVTKLICKNIDYVIHMENKKVKEIARIIGSEGDVPYFDIIYTIN